MWRQSQMERDRLREAWRTCDSQTIRMYSSTEKRSQSSCHPLIKTSYVVKFKQVRKIENLPSHSDWQKWKLHSAFCCWNDQSTTLIIFQAKRPTLCVPASQMFLKDLLLNITGNEISLDFTLLVRQNKKFEDINLEMATGVFLHFLTFYWQKDESKK